MFNGILKIFENFLGESKNGLSDKNQWQHNCPYCQIDGDGKYNLECNVKGVFRCWKCETSGPLSRLIKEWGNEHIFGEYKREVEELKLSKLYELFKDNGELESFEELFELPHCAKKLNPEKHKKAYDYCLSRGITLDKIKKYNIHCTDFNCSDWKMKNMIIIPSTDLFNHVNYWYGRSYLPNKYNIKHLLPETSKKKIIWNEGNIKWDGEVRLVEGCFDSLSVPGSIPLLGKELDPSYYLYQRLMDVERVVLMGDREDYSKWLNIYKLLQKSKLRGKVWMCKLPEGKDPNSIYVEQGSRGIAKELSKTFQISELDMLRF